MAKSAIVIGASGVIGRALSGRLLSHGLAVHGLSRARTPLPQGVEPIHADLTDPTGLAAALRSVGVKNVYFTAWSRQTTEAENIRVNGGMVAGVLEALGPKLEGGHVGLVTGLKHYLREAPWPSR